MYRSVSCGPPIVEESTKPWWKLNQYGKIESNATVLGIINYDSTACPFCETTLITVDINKRRCMSCNAYLIYNCETIPDVIEKRKEFGVYFSDLSSPTKPLYYWFAKDAKLLYAICSTNIKFEDG